MSKVWRICVVEADAALNQNLVNSLRKDGYVVQGVMKTADATRILWSEEYDVVICDLNLPSADGFELLHWLRAYRSNVHPIVLGDASRTRENDQRIQALESGAVSYIEKPVDLHLLKDELRRLLQQTGFTASLDSFDLLDVIQIITMSRKSITLLINTGLEERGVLRFHNGDLAWAEYGILHGEEAFFALAAHKNGTVTQQLSDGQVATNVTQPLSRLIFQALQYRSKYADKQQPLGQGPGEIGSSSVLQSLPLSGSSPELSLSGDIDDSPFLFTSEEILPHDADPIQQMPQFGQATPAFSTPQEMLSPTAQMDLHALHEAMNTSQSSPLQKETNMLENDSAQMPSWLTEQPTSAHIPARSPTHSSSSKQTPIPPISPSLSSEMRQIQAIQSAQVPPHRTTDALPKSQHPASYIQTSTPETEERRPSSPQWLQESQRSSSSPQWSPQESQRSSSSPQWPPQEPQRSSSSPQWLQESQRSSSSPQWSPQESQRSSSSPQWSPQESQRSSSSPQWPPQEPQRSSSSPQWLQESQRSSSSPQWSPQEPQRPPSSPQWSQESQRPSSSPQHRLTGQSGTFERTPGRQNPADALREHNLTQSSAPAQAQRQVPRKNYAVLVSALQTLGYTLPGFIAAAVIDVDNHLIAQVAMDEKDKAQIWQLLGTIQQSVLNALQANEWGMYQEMIVTTASRHVLTHAIGGDKKAFLVLITRREANPTESRELMTNVEGAIAAALS